ncbi:MAG TPA: hypothetical protein DIC64_01675 [Alphaproteobacteria bacterium]|nr:hypothetical protein [Alphaproteobacteria bacterium]
MPANEILFLTALAILTVICFCDVFFAKHTHIICRFNRETILEGITFSVPNLGKACFWLLTAVPLLMLVSIVLAPTLNPEISWFRNLIGDIFLYILYLMLAFLYAAGIWFVFRFIKKLISRIV